MQVAQQRQPRPQMQRILRSRITQAPTQRIILCLYQIQAEIIPPQHHQQS